MLSQFRRIVVLWPVGLFTGGLALIVVGVALAVNVPVALIVLGTALAAAAIQEVYF